MRVFSLITEIYKETSTIACENSFAHGIKRLYFLVLSLPILEQVFAWLKADNNPLLARELAEEPRMKECLFRPYINNHWSPLQKIKTMMAHYHLVSHCASLLDLPFSKFKKIAEIESEGHKLNLVLHKPDWMIGEGEIALSLFYGNLGEIFIVMLTLAGEKPQLSLIVGGIQGVDRENINEIYKDLTKAFHGFRPRDLLVKITKILAQELGCETVLCISDAAHKNNLWYSQAYKFTSYDTIWREHGASELSQGFYRLTAGLEKRDHSDIPTKKRAQYRKRYELLENIQLQIRQTIQHSPEPQPIDLAYQ